MNLQVAMIVTNGVCLSIDLKDLGSSILCYRSSPWITILIHTPCITFNLEKKVASIIFWLQATLAFLYFFIRTPRRGFFSPKKNTMAPCQAGALDAAAKALGVNAGALLGALLAGQANPQTDPG